MKRMRIEQSDCAMKVSTDACILGAWTPLGNDCSHILDIGTGTGLLALMIAQRQPQANIDAIEIEPAAFRQAQTNIVQSIYSGQISVHEVDAKQWQSDVLYDMIICNPPFFTNSLKGDNSQRNLARHNDELGFEDLLKVITKLLSLDGIASILLPTSELPKWQNELGRTALKTVKHLEIKPFAQSAANRVIALLSLQEGQFSTEKLVIYKAPKTYTEEFTSLMRPFYLHL